MEVNRTKCATVSYVIDENRRRACDDRLFVFREVSEIPDIPDYSAKNGQIKASKNRTEGNKGACPENHEFTARNREQDSRGQHTRSRMSRLLMERRKFFNPKYAVESRCTGSLFTRALVTISRPTSQNDNHRVH
jgi:hypothetical protein